MVSSGGGSRRRSRRESQSLSHCRSPFSDRRPSKRENEPSSACHVWKSEVAEMRFSWKSNRRDESLGGTDVKAESFRARNAPFFLSLQNRVALSGHMQIWSLL